MSYIADIASDKMNQKFKDALPSSLYSSHYDLAKEYGGTPAAWASFLKEPDIKRFIEREIAAIAEAAARKALNTLSGNDSITSQQVAAIKQILDKSQLIQQKGNSRQSIILTYIPKKEYNQ